MDIVLLIRIRETMKGRMIIWTIFIVGGAVAGFFLDGMLFEGIQKNICFHIISFILGLAMLRIVILISRNTGRKLAKYGRKGELPRMQTNVLVTNGVYKYMRHPMHLGLFFFPLSFALLIGSPSFILIIAPIEIIFMIIMIKLIEEPQAIAKFGEEYREYMKNVPAFCFKIECLKMLFKQVERDN